MDNSYRRVSAMQNSATQHAVDTKILHNHIIEYINNNRDDFWSEDPFTIAEFGSADGSNSVGILHQVISTIRSQNPSKTIKIICNDLPMADFTSLFQNLDVLKQEFGNIFISAIGESFYSQVLPSNSVDLAFSFTSVHWAQKAPCFINSLLFTGNETEKLDPEAVTAWKKQGEQDWELFLEMRYAELKRHGFIYVSTIQFAESSTQGLIGDESTNREAMSAVVRVLEEYNCEEYKTEFNVPAIIRNRQDFVRPLEKDHDAVAFQLDYYNDFCFKLEKFTNMIENGDRQEFLEVMKAATKAVIGLMFKSKLEKITRLSPEQREIIWNKIFDEMYTTLVIVSDKDQGFKYCEMVFSKP